MPRTDSLFPAPPRRRGRVEAAVDRAVRAGRDAGMLEAVDGGIVASLRVLARTLDALEADPDTPHGTVAYAAAEFRKTLAECGMTPMSREDADDDDAGAELAAVLRLGTAADRDGGPGR